MTLRAIRASLVLLLLSVTAASATERVALVIGNANYANEALALKNPVNDAEALSAALSDLGFVVTKAVDQDRVTLENTLDRFEVEMKGAEIALLFFAGHGVQLGGENHLLTAGFSDLDLAEVAHEAVTLGDIRRRFARANPDLGVIILDACRNNPFTERGQIARGLSRSQGSAGVLIAYATDPGNVAFDGAGENSVFTKALIENIATPALETRLMFGRVRQQVAIETSGLQVPWVEESVLGEYYFGSKDQPQTTEAEVAADIDTWRRVTIDNDTAAYRGYLDAFPDGLFRKFAEDRLETRPAAGLQIGVSGERVAALLLQADPVQTSEALAVLGYLPPTRGLVPATEEIERALTSYATETVGEGELTTDRLYLDAAQVVVVLGAATAQHIREDIKGLKATEIGLQVVEESLALFELMAETDETYRQALPEIYIAVDEFHASRAKILARLDESRSYYAGLLDTGESHFSPYLTRSLAGLRDRSRSLGRFEQAVVEDADNFIRHAHEAGADDIRGSYGWLSEFIPAD